jgi:NmrA-like family
VKAIKTDYTHASLVSAFQGQDAVVSTISTSSLTEQKRVIDAAVEAGVKRFIPSDFGWDTSGPISLEVAPCTVMKKDPVEYLREKEKDGMSWTSIINGLWVDWVSKLFQMWCPTNILQVSKVPEWPWWDVKNRTFTRFDDGDAILEASTLDQVGRAIAAVLSPENTEFTRNTFVYIHSYVLTQNKLLDMFKAITGDNNWAVTPSKVEDINRLGKEKFFRLTKDKSLDELGDVPEFQMAIVLLISSGCFGLGGVNQFGSKSKYWMDKLGLTEEDPEAVFRRVVAEIEAQA